MRLQPFTSLRAEGDAAAGGGSGEVAAQAAAADAAKGAGGGGDAAAQAAAAAKPKPFFEGLYGADGKIDKTAFDRLPDHLKAHKDQFAKYETIEAMLAGFGNAHSMAVKKALAPLDPSAPPEVQAERKAHLDVINNVPKEAKGYGITKPADLPAEFWHQEGADKFSELCHKFSVSPEFAKAAIALQTDMTKGELAAAKTQEEAYYKKQDDTFAAEIQKQGLAADKASELAARGAASLGIDVKDPLYKSAGVRLAAIRHAQLVSEDKLVTGDPTKSQLGNERDMARDIMANPANPLHKAWSDANDPRHEEAKAKVDALYAAYKPRGGG